MNTIVAAACGRSCNLYLGKQEAESMTGSEWEIM